MKVDKKDLDKWKVKGVSRTQIDDFYNLAQQRTTEIEKLSDALKSHQDGSKDRKLKAFDSETKSFLDISEYDLWVEFRYSGWDNNRAGDALKKEYPKLWEAFEKEEDAKTEYKRWMFQTFGFDFEAMSPVNLVRLVLSLIQTHSSE